MNKDIRLVNILRVSNVSPIVDYSYRFFIFVIFVCCSCFVYFFVCFVRIYKSISNIMNTYTLLNYLSQTRICVCVCILLMQEWKRWTYLNFFLLFCFVLMKKKDAIFYLNLKRTDGPERALTRSDLYIFIGVGFDLSMF